MKFDNSLLHCYSSVINNDVLVLNLSKDLYGGLPMGPSRHFTQHPVTRGQQAVLLWYKVPIDVSKASIFYDKKKKKLKDNEFTLGFINCLN